MKYLKNFNQIFENKDKEALAWSYLRSLVSFPELYNKDVSIWYSIIDMVPWEAFYEEYMDFEDAEPDITPEEYRNYEKMYADKKDNYSFDLFMATLEGLTDYYIEGFSPVYWSIHDKDIEWYMKEFDKPKIVAEMMKKIMDMEGLHDIDTDPGFTKI